MRLLWSRQANWTLLWVILGLAFLLLGRMVFGQETGPDGGAPPPQPPPAVPPADRRPEAEPAERRPAVDAVRVEDLFTLFSDPHAPAGLGLNPQQLRVALMLHNTGDKPVAVGLLKVEWLAGRHVLASENAPGPKDPVLAGGKLYHTFAIPGARWGGATPVRVSTGHAMIVEPDPAEREELRRKARQRDQLRVLNPKPTFRFNIPWGREFTVFNPGGPARGVTVELIGRDVRGAAVQWLLLRAELLDKGYTQVRQDAVEDPAAGRVFQLVGFAQKPDTHPMTYDARVVEVGADPADR